MDKLPSLTAQQLSGPPPARADRSQALPESELSWRRLVKEEPRLKELQREIDQIGLDTADDERFCANSVWYGYGEEHGGYKEQVVELVGWYAQNPKLRSIAAYDIGCDYLYYRLPDCRGCVCFA